MDVKKNNKKSGNLSKSPKSCKKCRGKDKPLGLTADEVDLSIKNMIAFIEQEGTERADDIDAKTEEQYNIIKGNAVQEGRLKIDSEYEMKEQMMLKNNTTYTSLSAIRIRFNEMNNKQDLVQDIKEDVRKQILEDMKCKSRYGYIFQLLLLEGLFKLLEEFVEVQCCEGDIGLFEKVKPNIILAYKARTNLDLNLEVNKEEFLPESCMGGVKLNVKNNTISTLNTLDLRLERVIEKLLPAIQKGLNIYKKKTTHAK